MGNKKYFIAGLGLVASLLFFCTTAYLLVRNGYVRDERIYVSDFIGNGLWIVLIGTFISFIIFLVALRIKTGKLSLAVASFTLVILLVSGLIITIGWIIQIITLSF